MDKNGLIIEDDSCCRDFIELEDLFDSLPYDAKGIFILIDNIPDHLRNLKLEDITSLPIIIIEVDGNTKGSMKKLDQLYYQVFKRKNLNYIDGSIIVNEDNFNLNIDLSPNCNISNSNESKLYNIDKSSISKFIGRNSDLASISRELNRIEDKELVLVIKGSGGIGKTTIINKLAVELSRRDKYDGGVHFIDCEPISDFEQFHHKLSSVFELQSAQYLIEHLVNYYDNKKRLIIIDNFESILNIEGNTEELKCKYLALIGELSAFSSIIITTRESCGESWEEEYTLRSLESEEALLLFNKATKNKYLSSDEQIYIRENILENHLDRNPLAIKLIASNIPPGKNIYDLESDLQELFSSIDCLDYFNQSTDLNVNRKNSLLGSVIYSYRTLNDIDQKALELISFFPDGISLSALKKVALNRQNESKTKQVKSLITDNSIKTLSNKSLIEDSNSNIKLHPIINRFVFIKANQNTEHDSYWQNVTNYNISLVEILDEMLYKNEKLSLDIALSNINNFLIILEMGHKINFKVIEPESYLDYCDSLLTFTTNLCLNRSFSSKSLAFVEKAEAEETNIPARLLKSVKLQHYFSLYFGGEFEHAFRKIQQMYPHEEIISADPNNRFEYLDSMATSCIYSMEGYTNLDLKHLTTIQGNSKIYYPSVFYEKCILNVEYLNACQRDLSYYESHRLLNTLDINDLNSKIESLHPNQHLEKCQLSYILHLSCPLSDSEIKKLVSVNPFTSGLKCLMLATNQELVFVKDAENCAKQRDKVEELYLKASDNLFHIKYFYIHSQYHYCDFLRKSGAISQFKKIQESSIRLSKEYDYPYWVHKFENLTIDDPKVLESSELQSTGGIDISEFINRSLKAAKYYKASQGDNR
ncbi:NB-ARC domain-containing protein [Vibrio splendidus]|uniref:NB-ARC domain-containing protein n=1 Tax=Vibrio splendidus TaxID=29497 RepID=UPI000D347D55|nr:NB-ARC domain-containing protein [Vibrio splendidus]PTO59742.1 hypothetical protein CWN96_20775 [Vibrio splendidus]